MSSRRNSCSQLCVPGVPWLGSNWQTSAAPASFRPAPLPGANPRAPGHHSRSGWARTAALPGSTWPVPGWGREQREEREEGGRAV